MEKPQITLAEKYPDFDFSEKNTIGLAKEPGVKYTETLFIKFADYRWPWPC